MPDENTYFHAHPTAAFQEVDNEVFVVTEDNRLHNLRDDVAVAIWEELERAPIDIQSLTASITSKFDVEPSIARTDIDTFLEEALEKKLVIEVANPPLIREES